MRILNGKYKGKKIQTLNKSFLRPTTSRTREAIFNILENNEYFKNLEFNDLVFLEIFCGSAIVSFEAYSRGFRKIILIDKNKEIKKLFDKNVQLFNPENFNFLKYDALKLSQISTKADICFMDAPYDKNYTEQILTNLHKHSLIKINAIVIVEIRKNITINHGLEYEIICNKTYGNSRLIFFCYKGED